MTSNYSLYNEKCLQNLLNEVELDLIHIRHHFNFGFEDEGLVTSFQCRTNLSHT